MLLLVALFEFGPWWSQIATQTVPIECNKRPLIDCGNPEKGVILCLGKIQGKLKKEGSVSIGLLRMKRS